MKTFVELAALRDDLRTAVRLVGEGEEIVLRYRGLTKELEREGRGNLETALLARNVLKVMEDMQARRIEHRDRLKQQFAEIEGANDCTMRAEPSGPTLGASEGQLLSIGWPLLHFGCRTRPPRIPRLGEVGTVAGAKMWANRLF